MQVHEVTAFSDISRDIAIANALSKLAAFAEHDARL